MDTVLKSLLIELQCPVCKFYMEPPIRQCATGHSICSRCFEQVHNCPYCRGPKGEKIRNYSLEAIYGKLIITCKNFYLGCDFSSVGKQISEHEKKCQYNSRSCMLPKCSWTGTIKKIKEHMYEKHSALVNKQGEELFIMKVFMKVDNARSFCRYSSSSIVIAHKECFLLMLEMDDLTGNTLIGFCFIFALRIMIKIYSTLIDIQNRF